MIKVLKKAFSILEFIAEEPERPYQIKEICERFKLNQASCSHIIKTLFLEGYVEKSPNKTGYLLGRKPYLLVKNGKYSNYIIPLVKTHLHDLANELNESVIITTIQAGKPYVIYHINQNNAELEVKFDSYAKSSMYSLATGRVLLAHQSSKFLDSYIKKNGVPLNEWDNINDAKFLKKKLDEIKGKGYSLICKNTDVAKLAFPIIGTDGKIIASLGVAIPLSRYDRLNQDKLIESMKKCVDIINKKFK